ncbi:YkgJ family cysteine cluster protein [Acutalibacter muris]|uniref:YkgJ family cysteine cluster protein n=1 Tax=Acutalibacter muris TaxID=1796620 RepID=A0A1Z2XPB7_9FIRM|nr:YkgJ family cysteine cluster protein [Acutalibacter muris]ANU53034.1 zinc/iron-chelating domain-containing protein [Hungateiclostridiaceae bacterium KB18]ASB40292.1 zinc/iron-chelating domain-containing protein [Acutalibacter muris]QQR29583.1 YkgJ family cysteine cluster protein [Acutalibacter muris]
MNARIKEILKEYESNQLEPDEPFRFHCTMCGKCCINREDILLNPRDMYNLAKELKMTPREVMNAYCETYIGSDSRLPVVRLKPRGEIKRCPLLKDTKCSVHRAKPTVCALFPIGRGIVQKKGSTVALTAKDIRYFLTDPGCGDDSETHTVREWLEDFGLPVEDEFFVEWQKCLVELSQRFRRLEKKLGADMGPIWSLTGTIFFLMYEMEKPFEPQFKTHLGEVYEMIYELAEEGGK